VRRSIEGRTHINFPDDIQEHEWTYAVIDIRVEILHDVVHDIINNLTSLARPYNTYRSIDATLRIRIHGIDKVVFERKRVKRSQDNLIRIQIESPVLFQIPPPKEIRLKIRGIVGKKVLATNHFNIQVRKPIYIIYLTTCILKILFLSIPSIHKIESSMSDGNVSGSLKKNTLGKKVCIQNEKDQSLNQSLFHRFWL
jgi:hypothetical protein